MLVTLPRSEGWGIVLKRTWNKIRKSALSLGERFLPRPPLGGIRNRIFIYFLLFTCLLLLILWLFQIVFLDEFYRMQKRDMLRSSAESIVRNIDNENLQALAYRISERNNVCILITDENMRPLVEAEAWNGCIIHHLGPRTLLQIVRNSLNNEAKSGFVDFPLGGFRNHVYDARQFRGPVPPGDEGNVSSMVLVTRGMKANEKNVYIFLNCLVTPVGSTVDTIRNQLYFISAFLVLTSFLLSMVLSRRITRPLEEITTAASALSRGEYKPVENVSYLEINQLNRQLLQTAKDLHRVEEMQQELLANISHDLRTPLTLIEGYAEIVRDLPDEGTPENMQIIIDETRRLSTLVNAILELSTAKKGMDELECRNFDLTACVEEILKRYQKLTEQDGYQILFEPNQHVIVSADEMKVQQVVYNLINNAITYTGSDKLVVIRQLVHDEIVRIEVTDSSEGIAPEEIDHIWDRYYRGKKPHKRATVGSGLGLSIVKGILDRHGLKYGVRSHAGEGSTFWFEIGTKK